MSNTITVEIIADTSQLERAFKRAEMLITRSWWRRRCLRLALWRLDRRAAA
jgi:hypothetical protein